ncbi:LON peptidase substrate-binding domain-containing protein [Pseudomonas mangrovi]|uniref:ATP-dependent protease n=1 Tax=Pseudomonas mangrovi TaxID=2161748 RepID=A0A2T5P8N4_9PSED|nr:LON peptidase substrate-binding domain-containing protein [Pseudomonas mangrovi]PTU74096.1 ATP-dependent protease [Pseudomonas mangrovi]
MLPLFPLDTVLFPGCRLDLQIFEPRYLDMISGCLRRDQGFGVVAILEGREVGAAPDRLASVNCEARVVDWQQRPNGLLGIRVEGARRFAVRTLQVADNQAVSAEVEWLSEPADQPAGVEHAELQALLAALIEHPLVVDLGLDEPVSGRQLLADRLAYLLPLERAQKLELLAELDASRRLRQIAEWVALLQE